MLGVCIIWLFFTDEYLFLGKSYEWWSYEWLELRTEELRTLVIANGRIASCERMDRSALAIISSKLGRVANGRIAN
jgi:hypothetical protein